MNFKTLLKLNVAISTIVLIAKCFSSKNVKAILARTPYRIIKEMHEVFDLERKKDIRLKQINRFELDAPKLKQLIEEKQVENLKAIFGIEAGSGSRKLTAQFEGITKSGEKVFIDSNGDENDSKELAKLIQEKNKFPMGLKDFPNTITMDACGINRIIGETKCRKLFFIPCIEDGWEKGNVSNANRIIHFTIGVLGSNERGTDVHDGHKIPKGLADAIDGEETWPYANFTWYGN